MMSRPCPQKLQPRFPPYPLEVTNQAPSLAIMMVMLTATATFTACISRLCASVGPVEGGASGATRVSRLSSSSLDLRDVHQLDAEEVRLRLGGGNAAAEEEVEQATRHGKRWKPGIWRVGRSRPVVPG